MHLPAGVNADGFSILVRRMNPPLPAKTLAAIDEYNAVEGLDAAPCRPNETKVSITDHPITLGSFASPVSCRGTPHDW